MEKRRKRHTKQQKKEKRRESKAAKGSKRMASAVLLPVAVPAPAVLLQVAVAVPVPPGFLLREEVPVHVDDAYLAHVRLLRVAKSRETPGQIKVKPQSSYEYP